MFEEKNDDCNHAWIKTVLLYKFGKEKAIVNDVLRCPIYKRLSFYFQVKKS